MSKYTIGEAAKHTGIPKSHLLSAVSTGAILVEYRQKMKKNKGGCEAETIIDRKELDRFAEAYFSPLNERFAEREDKPVPALDSDKKEAGRIRKEIERRLEARLQKEAW
jgi:hypothetical protein